jgi:hypothetical protein
MINTWQEFTASGRPQGGSIPEDLRDFVENVSPIDRPALALFRRTKVNTTFIEWLEDSLPSRAYNAWIEGVDATDLSLGMPTRSYTHVQTFARWGKASDEQRAVDHKGFSDTLLYKENQAIQATLNDIEHAIHRQSAATGSTSAARKLNGLLNIFSTNFTASSGTTFTESVWGDLVQLFRDNTDVKPTVCFVNSYLKRTISQFDTKVTRNVGAAEKIQYNVIERHVSDFGDINIFHSRDQLSAASKTTYGNSIVLLDPAYFETGWLQPLMSEVLARAGLSTQFQISAMLTLLYRSEKAGGGGTGFVSYIS